MVRVIVGSRDIDTINKIDKKTMRGTSTLSSDAGMMRREEGLR